jgi:hypothetical protein
MERDKEISKELLQEIHEELTAFSKYPKPDIPIKEVEKKILFRIGCQPEKSKRGSAFKYSHRVLEKHTSYTAGIFGVHRKGGSKDNPLIRRNDFKAYLLPHILRILAVLEREEDEQQET